MATYSEKLIQEMLSQFQPGAVSLSKNLFSAPLAHSANSLMVSFLENEDGIRYAMCDTSECDDSDYICS